MTFEPLSDKLASLSDKGSKVTYANKNEAADGLGTRLQPPPTLETEEVGHGHVTCEFIWRLTIVKCVLGSLYEYLNKLDIIGKLQWSRF